MNRSIVKAAMAILTAMLSLPAYSAPIELEYSGKVYTYFRGAIDHSKTGNTITGRITYDPSAPANSWGTPGFQFTAQQDAGCVYYTNGECVSDNGSHASPLVSSASYTLPGETVQIVSASGTQGSSHYLHLGFSNNMFALGLQNQTYYMLSNPDGSTTTQVIFTYVSLILQGDSQLYDTTDLAAVPVLANANLTRQLYFTVENYSTHCPLNQQCTYDYSSPSNYYFVANLDELRQVAPPDDTNVPEPGTWALLLAAFAAMAALRRRTRH